MILDLAQRALDNDEECVLATVVRLDGSGYGRPGARLLMTESGERSGYISGGCLEKDLCRRAWSMTANGPKLIAFDTRGNAVQPGPFNTGCDGVVSVLCQRFLGQLPLELQAQKYTFDSGKAIKVAAVYRSESSNFQVGDIVTQSIEGTKLSVAANADRRNHVETKLNQLLDKSEKTKSVIFDDSRGSTVEVFVEIVTPPKRLVIFGAGDDVQPVYEFARSLNWRVTIVGRRAELADSNRFPHADVRTGDATQIAQEMLIDDQTDVLMMSHDFDQDVRVLPAILDSPANLIGILGPKRRLGRLIWQIEQRGRRLNNHDIDRIRAPIGLDIGASTPDEIAISIVSELIAHSKSRRGGFLHDRRMELNTPHVVEDQSVSVSRLYHSEDSIVPTQCELRS